MLEEEALTELSVEMDIEGNLNLEVAGSILA